MTTLLIDPSMVRFFSGSSNPQLACDIANYLGVPLDDIKVKTSVAVRPDVQNRGIGGDLIRAGIAEVRRQGWDAIFLVGHVDYYPRFSFQHAAGMNVTAEPGVNMAHFFFMEMWEGAVGSVPLTVKFAPEFWQFA